MRNNDRIIHLILEMFKFTNFTSNGLQLENGTNKSFWYILSKPKDLNKFFIFYFDKKSFKINLKIFLIYLTIYIFKINSCLILNFHSNIAKKFNKFLLNDRLGIILNRNTENDVPFDVNLYLNFLDDKFKSFRVGGYIPHKDEPEILFCSIENLLYQEIEVTLFDDNSTNQNLNLIYESNIINKSKIIQLENFGFYNWTYILDKIDQESSTSSFNYIIRNDADECLRSPIDNFSLRQFLYFVYLCKFEKVDSVVVNLHSESGELNKFESATHFSFPNTQDYESVLRAWKNDQKLVNLSVTGGHNLPDNKEFFPLKFTLFHAPFRNENQVRTKIDSRITRGAKEYEEKGWHYHLFDKEVSDLLKIPEDSFILSFEALNKTQLIRKFKIDIKYDKSL
jgi:hypothetical protein